MQYIYISLPIYHSKGGRQSLLSKVILIALKRSKTDGNHSANQKYIEFPYFLAIFLYNKYILW